MVENGMGWFLWLLLLLAFAFVIWLFIKAAQSRGSSNFVKKETDLEILEGRYIRGEIDEAEYKQKKAELVGKKSKSTDER
jgi:uncharacterized membrane protein